MSFMTALAPIDELGSRQALDLSFSVFGISFSCVFASKAKEIGLVMNFMLLNLYTTCRAESEVILIHIMTAARAEGSKHLWWQTHCPVKQSIADTYCRLFWDLQHEASS